MKLYFLALFITHTTFLFFIFCSASQLYNTPVLQKAHAEKGGPHVHGMVFDVGEGLVKELDVDFKSLVNK